MEMNNLPPTRTELTVGTVKKCYRYMFHNRGIDEGYRCNRSGCDGFMSLVWDEPCYCSALGHLAPCGSCERVRTECDKCGFDPNDNIQNSPTRTKLAVGILGVLGLVAGSVFWVWDRILEVMR